MKPLVIEALMPGFRLAALGGLPAMLHPDDERTAIEQFHERYAHGGGWHPIPGFTLHGNKLDYPGDPTLMPCVRMLFRDEIIYVYEYSIVAVVQPDGSFQVARMD